MNNGRKAAITAVVAGVVAAPLAIASPTAKADELADLRANQELLQRRLDQLAQGIPSAGGGYTGGISHYGVYPANVTPEAGRGIVGGSFPRSFLIPGTDTSLRVGGEVRTNILYWLSGGNPNSSPQSTNAGATGQVESIPLKFHVPTAGVAARGRSGEFFQISPQQSKLNVETRTPTAWGEARTFVEFDFAGSNGFVPGGGRPTAISDSLVPRLRFAYGTLGGWLAGQANSNFSDPDANGEAIDFGGNVGEPGVVRIPQVRYTQPLAPWSIPGAFSMSVETPSSSAWIPTAGVLGSDAGAVGGLGVASTTTNPFTGLPVGETPVVSAPIPQPLKSPIPSLTAAWYIPQPWGHMDYSVMMRGDQLKDGLYVDRTFLGYGVHFGGDVKPGWFGWAKDDIIFHFVYGNGISTYLNASTNFGLITNYPVAAPPTPAAAALVQARETVEYGGEIGYQHWWAPNVRSNLNVGFNWHDIPTNLRTITSATTSSGVSAVCVGGSAAASTASGGCGLNKRLITAHANVIWNPVPFVDVGLEYMWGQRLTLSRVKGDENVVISKLAVKF